MRTYDDFGEIDRFAYVTFKKDHSKIWLDK